MNLFRQETIIHSTKTPIEIAESLRAITGEHLPFNNEFLGTITDKEFLITPVIYYKNSFSPYLKGTVTPTDIGSDITIIAEPHYRGLTITSLLLLILTIINVFIKGIIALIKTGITDYNLFQIFCPVILVLIIPISHYFFTVPTKAAFNRLKELLK